ncbi:GT-D fold domain-containing glycosyltransferase [Paenibacillus sp. LHD-38]|uniref:GT-D fold domain-containing glycosyltransferase n=1 Tax=Paenibacillus sp. LHD-38 TaxID=3072143 RepID=UPI00280D1886|nr:GT-D fold domain-containing glycosyltransferase [Paenibacillus sp. LHD-38]MDQ8735766.1 GT-D fold domain-containing glycosyltransferase [Paenibacillus sp. LHD-38]
MAKLNSDQVLARIKEALDHQRPFSLIRIGDGENVIMAQKSVWSLREVLRTPWARRANHPVRTRSARLGHKEKGVTLPNLKLRNQMVRSIRKADIVGILPIKDKIKAPKRVRRPLTNKIFRYYKLRPRFTCDAFINREFASKPEFWEVLRGKRILIITEHAKKLKEVLQSDPYRMVITGAIIFTHFKQMSKTLNKVEGMKDQFDIALISCGVNAVVMAPEVARLTGKVAIDFGKGPKVVFNKPKTLVEKSNVSLMNRLILLSNDAMEAKDRLSGEDMKSLSENGSETLNGEKDEDYFDSKGISSIQNLNDRHTLFM